jgi:CBS domain-containing protein
MSVGRIATRVVATASGSERILDVARRMVEYNVGCVVVVDGGNEPVGIVTDRDIVIRGVAEELDPSETPVSVIMTSEVRSVNEATPIEQALALMGSAGTRRLVVTGNESKVVGVVSVDDVIELLVGEAESLGKLLRNEGARLSG